MSKLLDAHPTLPRNGEKRSFDWLGIAVTVFESSFLACIVLVAKDWFLSGSEHYPYRQSLQMLCGVLGSWFAYLNLSKRYPNVGSHTGGSKSKRIPQHISFRMMSVGWTISIGLYVAYLLVLRPGKMPSSGDDIAWLGNGIGTTVQGGLLSGALIAEELGWCIFPILTILLLTAIFLGLTNLSQNLRRECIASQLTLSCVIFFIPLCILGALLASPQQTLLSSESPWGTWLFFASIAFLGARGRPAMRSDLRRRPQRYSRQARLLCFLGFIAAGIILNFALGHSVSPYVVNRNAIQSMDFAELPKVSSPMQDATIAMEDHTFYQHHGFDWIAMHHALRFDLRESQIKEGGSTITQQLAKNLFLTNDRTVWRKIKEAAYTWELERMLPKSRILELYLNSIDYGMGQRGIMAAARYYFHKTPDKLTLAESAILVGIVPDPMQKHVDPQRLLDGQHTALSRVRYFFPDRYSQEDCDLASWYPLNMLIYPDKDAWDRGATCQIPADWHGVKFCFFADPDEPMPIDQASLSLKNRLAGFLDDAHEHLHLVGIDHLGVYNDRSTRQEEKVISSHAYGQAIDISGFRFADGSRVSVKDHNNPKVLARLAPLEAMLKRRFDAVVDWNDNSLHQTHFHVEVKGPRPTTPRPVQDPPAKSVDETMAEIQGAKRLPLRIATWLSGALVRQSTSHSCGEACVATILSDYLKNSTSEPQLIHLLGTENVVGTGGADLIRAFKARGVQAVESVVTSDELLDEIATTGLPAVVTLARPAGHWIVVVGEWGDYLLISDPLRGNVMMPKNEFYARSDGETVSVERTKL